MRRVLEPVPAVLSGVAPSAVPTRSGRPPSRFHVPLVVDDAIDRPELLERVSAAVRGPVTLVSAAAGSGKTSLLAAWAAQQRSPGPLLWMTVEPEDARPEAFWSGLVDGLARADPSFAGLDLDDPDRPVDRGLLDALVWRLTEQDAPWVVVLDDAHHLTDRAVGDGLAYLLRSCEGHLRLVLLARVDPPLPWHRYRLDGGLTELRQTDLALTASEVSALLRTAGLDLPDGVSRSVLERTDGWVAGVRFAARALHGRPPTDAERWCTSDAHAGEEGVVGYLQTEVLDPQPADLRAAVLRCAVVETLEPGLVESMAGTTDGDRLVDRLLAAGALLTPVERAATPTALRFQPQLRDLALARLAEQGPDAVTGAHRRAAQWYADQGRLGACTEHAVRAGAWELAAAAAVDGLAVVAAVAGDPDDGLLALGDAMPAAVAGMPAALVRAARASQEGDAATLSAELGRARDGLEADGPALHVRLLTLAVLEATAALHEGDEPTASGAMATGERLLRRLGSVPPVRRAQAAALLAVLRCERDLLRGDLAGVVRGATDARLAPERPDRTPGPLLGRARAAAALARSMTGQLRRGASAAHLVLGSASPAAGPLPGTAASDGAGDPYLARATLAVAWAATEVYDLDAAQAHAAAAERRGALDDRVDATVLALVRARVLRARGDQSSATEVLRAARASGHALPPSWDARVLAALATIEAEVRPSLAPTAAPDRPSPTRPSAPVGPADALTLDVRLELLVQRAARAEQTGDRDRALALLERALRLGEPERMRRPFVESPVAVRRLLRTTGTLPSGWLGVPSEPARAARERAATSGSGRPAAERGSVPVPVSGAGGRRAGGGEVEHRAAVAGRPGGVAPKVLGSVASVDGAYERLTAKELEVLGHLADLLSTVEVASVMYVSVNTVRTHVRSILRKLDVARRHEAVRRAWELGLLTSAGVPGAGRRVLVPPGAGVSGAEDA